MNKEPSNNSGGALSHLVEAATALANLTSIGDTEGSGRSGYLLQQQQQQQQQPPGVSCILTTNSTSNNNNSDKKHVILNDEDENLPQQPSPSSSTTATILSPSSASARPPVNNKEIFPTRLMAMLNDASLADVITWLPHGRSFVIVRPDVFTERVLPKYLPPADARSSTKYPSFTRKLNRWGFRQATRGPDTGAFHHPLFQRNKPELCLEMVCQRSRDRRNLPAKKRQIAALTKESLDTFNGANLQLQQQQQTTQQLIHPAVATVSVSGDSQSSISATSNNSSCAATSMKVTPGITTDTTLMQRALRQRNEEERMRVAKAMLYHAYLDAIQQKGSPGVV